MRFLGNLQATSYTNLHMNIWIVDKNHSFTYILVAIQGKIHYFIQIPKFHFHVKYPITQ